MRTVIGLMFLAGCSSGPETDCANGVDDDKDGLADAFDSDCTATDTTDETTETIDESAPFLFPNLSSMDLAVSVTIATRTLGDDISAPNPFCNEIFNQCDCTLHLLGDGTFVEGASTKGKFFGSWYLDETDCGPDLAEAIWYEDMATKVYHTFIWGADGDTLDTWVAHKDEEKDELVPEEEGPKAAKQFYVASMDTPYSGLSASYEEVGSEDNSDAMISVYVTTTFEATFSE